MRLWKTEETLFSTFAFFVLFVDNNSSMGPHTPVAVTSTQLAEYLTPYNAPQQLSPSSLRVLSALCGLPLPAATPVTVTGTQLAARESNRGCPATTVPPSPQKMMDDRRSITIVITWR